MNDPNCRASTIAGHICTDSHGQIWDRPRVGPRPGTVCFFEAVSRLEEQRVLDETEAAAWAKWADDVASMTTLEQVIAS